MYVMGERQNATTQYIMPLWPRPYLTNDFRIHNCFSDPFADASKGAEDDVQDGLVHIRIQQRNGRKTLTTVQGLSSDYDLKKIVRACKKVGNFGTTNICKWAEFFHVLP